MITRGMYTLLLQFLMEKVTDNTNDFSFQDLEQGFSGEKTEFIPIYDGDVSLGNVPWVGMMDPTRRRPIKANSSFSQRLV